MCGMGTWSGLRVAGAVVSVLLMEELTLEPWVCAVGRKGQGCDWEGEWWPK